MSEWSVHVEARGPEPLGSDAADSIEHFSERFTDYSGAAAGGPGFDTYSAQFSVDAPGPDDAVVRGVEIFRNAAAVAGLPEWPIVDAQATEAGELDRQLAVPNFPELVGISEVGELLGVSRQRAHALATRNHDFPEPIARLASGPVWTRPSISRFVDEWPRKPGRPEGRLVLRRSYEVGTTIETAGGQLRRVTACRRLEDPNHDEPGWVLETEPA